MRQQKEENNRKKKVVASELLLVASWLPINLDINDAINDDPDVVAKGVEQGQVIA